jgi:hypothetical protein
MREKPLVAVPRKGVLLEAAELSGDKFFVLNRERATTKTFEDFARDGSANRPGGD